MDSVDIFTLNLTALDKLLRVLVTQYINNLINTSMDKYATSMAKYTHLDTIQTLIDYVYEDERKHYEESDRPKGHIYECILELQAWLNRQRKEQDNG